MESQEIIKTFSDLNFPWNKTIKAYQNKNGNKCVNEFEIIKKISEGAIWKVYSVLRYYYDENEQVKTRQYAMKKTHILTQQKRRYFKKEKMISYFEEVLNEVRILGILSNQGNKNVIQFHELLFDEQFPYIYVITDFCDVGPIMNRDNVNFNHFHNPKLIKLFLEKFNNKTLEISLEETDDNLVKHNSLPLYIKHKIAKILFKEIFLGLSYIHSFRIAHRDLKMENILLDSKELTPKIIDFSISTILEEGETTINEPGGSMHYQAPDMFDMEAKGYYDPFLADIWAVGICLYIFIYEQFPFDSEEDSELELQMKISNKELSFPYDCEEENFLPLLKGLLEKSPLKRLSNINEILNMKYFTN